MSDTVNLKKRARIIVRNISYKTTENDLRKHFEQFGEIVELQLLKRPDGKLVGCAFVQFTTVNQAAKAIAKCSNQDFLGRIVYVDWAVRKDQYIKSINTKNSSKTIIKEEVTEDENQNVKSEESEVSAPITKNENEDSSHDFKSEDSTDDEDNDIKNEIKIKKEDNYESSVKKNLLNDAEDGCTVFLKNVPFEASNDDVKKVCEKYGQIKYAIVNTDPVSGHSKGTAFVKFKVKESADLLLNANEDEVVLMDKVLSPFPALSRDNIKQKLQSEKQKSVKDARNLYLAKEGLIMAGSKAAEGVSASDMSKRHKLEQIKTQILKNLNRFISRNRLSIHNLPLSYNDKKLERMIIKNTKLRPHECRVMREKKPSVNFPNGKSKGFGFMSFNTHEDALFALRKLNNNPNIFGSKNRPIVAFSVEDRLVYNVKEKRLIKSRQNNPTYKAKLEKSDIKKQDSAIEKKNSKDNKKNINKVQLNKSCLNNNADTDDKGFTGVISKPGQYVRMRSNKKINEQSKQHSKNVSKLKRLQNKKLKPIKSIENEGNKKIKQKKPSKKDKHSTLVQKYKKLIDSTATLDNTRKRKKSKWYPN